MLETLDEAYRLIDTSLKMVIIRLVTSGSTPPTTASCEAARVDNGRLSL